MLTSYRPEAAEKCDCGIDWQRMEIRKVKWFGLYRTHQPYKLRLPYSNYPILSLTLDSVLMMCLRLEGLIIRMLNIKKITKNIISPRGRCWQCGRRLWLDRLNWHLILLPVIIVIVENEILHQECLRSPVYPALSSLPARQDHNDVMEATSPQLRPGGVG